MRTFLVTGGAGFIGSHIAEALARRGDKVRILDNLSTGNYENLTSFNEQAEFIDGCVTDAKLVAELVDGIDCVFHQAALASVPRSVQAPLDTNHACVTGTVTVLDGARRAGVRRFVYAGSSSCYGDQPFSSKRETDLPSTLSPYAAAKLAGEKYCEAFYHTYGLETVCIRYFNVFGPRQDPDSPYSAVIPLFITGMLAGKPSTIYGDGHQSRDFTYIDNVVHGNLLAADAENIGGRSFNVANGQQTSLLQIIAALENLLDVKTTPVHQPPRAGDVRESLADITLARQLLGYQPLVDLQEGLKRSIDYYRTLAARSESEKADGHQI